jgi:hypothetical protein
MLSAKIENGVVVNLIVGKLPGFIPTPEGQRVSIGWGYQDGTFSPPPVLEPEIEPWKKLTRFQFEMILELLGITQEQVFALINGLDWTDMEKLVARKKVETGGNDGRWSRENPLWDLLGPSLGVTKEQIDEKWQEAQAL